MPEEVARSRPAAWSVCQSGQKVGALLLLKHRMVDREAIVDAALANHWLPSPNGRAFSGEPSERSERPERTRGRRVRCNAMLARPFFTGRYGGKLQRLGR